MSDQRSQFASVFVCGRSQSGKTTICNAFASSGVQVVGASTILKEIASRLGMPKGNRAELLTAGEEIRRKYGATWFADELTKNVDKDRMVIFDGIRFPDTIRHIKKRSVASMLLFVDDNVTVLRDRYNRQSDQSVDFEVLRLHLHECYMEEVKAEADLVVEGSMTNIKPHNFADFISSLCSR